MVSLLLAIIYIAFISLGLPDSMLGSAWPVMHIELNAPLSFAGVISMTIACGTIVSSLLSDKLTKKFGAGLVTAVSVLMTAVAMFGFSISNAPWMLICWGVPYGLGAGAVDAALNNYVALHYNSRQMSWLHCFWGVGVSVSPYVMGYALSHNMSWHTGYRVISLFQVALTAILFLSLPLWKTRKGEVSDKNAAANTLSGALKIKGVKNILIAFFGYCALESTAGLWASTYMVEYRGIDPTVAANYASLYFIGITVGRFLNGFVADRFGDRNMIRTGLAVIAVGVVCVLMPVNAISLFGLVVIGLGCAPVYPCVIHSTPANFGPENSQAIVGIQMASAYSGSTLMPPLFGLIAQYVNVALYPLYLGIFAVLMFVMTESANKLVDANRAKRV